MASKSIKPAPQRHSNLNGSGSSNNATGASNSQLNSAIQENSDDVIEALYSPDYVVQPSDSTNVVVQSSDRFNNGQVSWKTSWDAPNGFHQETDIAQKGPTISVPFQFSEAMKDGELKDGDRVKFTAEAKVGNRVDRESREFIMRIPTEE